MAETARTVEIAIELLNILNLPSETLSVWIVAQAFFPKVKGFSRQKHVFLDKNLLSLMSSHWAIPEGKPVTDAISSRVFREIAFQALWPTHAGNIGLKSAVTEEKSHSS
ncbi:hypothetical protein EON81_15195 [bacterium]|nr:MAG: hypothetical protein EON81_15195 [bacterium]